MQVIILQRKSERLKALLEILNLILFLRLKEQQDTRIGHHHHLDINNCCSLEINPIKNKVLKYIFCEFILVVLMIGLVICVILACIPGIGLLPPQWKGRRCWLKSNESTPCADAWAFQRPGPAKFAGARLAKLWRVRMAFTGCALRLPSSRATLG